MTSRSGARPRMCQRPSVMTSPAPATATTIAIAEEIPLGAPEVNHSQEIFTPRGVVENSSSRALGPPATLSGRHRLHSWLADGLGSHTFSSPGRLPCGSASDLLDRLAEGLTYAVEGARDP